MDFKRALVTLLKGIFCKPIGLLSLLANTLLARKSVHSFNLFARLLTLLHISSLQSVFLCCTFASSSGMKG